MKYSHCNDFTPEKAFPGLHYGGKLRLQAQGLGIASLTSSETNVNFDFSLESQ